MNAEHLPPLALAVARWISFQQLVGRDCLFSEEYLSQPIAEYLLHHHAGRLIPEYEHPTFKGVSAGRPRQIDYALAHRASGHLNIAIECKWIGKKSDNQRILNDLLRLEVIAGQKRREPKCYLLVAGLLEDFKQNFYSTQLNAGKSRVAFARTLFDAPLNKSARFRVDVEKCPQPFRKMYQSYYDDYNVSLPQSFFTQNVARTTEHGIAVYIWQIIPMDRRLKFQPAW